MALSRPLLSAENSQRIVEEFQSIELECEKLAAFLTAAGMALPPSDSQDYWMQTRVCAAAAENIYTGLERVMAKLVLLLDGESVAHQDGWHKTLLRRLSGPFGGRQAVISTETHELGSKPNKVVDIFCI
jgi:hypothetical protein